MSPLKSSDDRDGLRRNGSLDHMNAADFIFDSEARLKSTRVTDNKIRTVIDQDKMVEFEQLAGVDRHAFYGVYHVSLGQVDTVAEAFEGFLSRILDDEELNSRALSNDSRLFEDTMISRKMCICRELYENFGSMDSKEYDDNGNPTPPKKHHPSCPMAKARLRCNEHGLLTGQDEEKSIVLRPPRLSHGRGYRGKNYYQLPPNQGRNSCC